MAKFKVSTALTTALVGGGIATGVLFGFFGAGALVTAIWPAALIITGAALLFGSMAFLAQYFRGRKAAEAAAQRPAAEDNTTAIDNPITAGADPAEELVAAVKNDKNEAAPTLALSQPDAIPKAMVILATEDKDNAEGKDNAVRNIQHLFQYIFSDPKPMLTKALSMAAEEGNKTAIDNLITAGADPSKALTMATKANNSTAMKLLQNAALDRTISEEIKVVEKNSTSITEALQKAKVAQRPPAEGNTTAIDNPITAGADPAEELAEAVKNDKNEAAPTLALSQPDAIPKAMVILATEDKDNAEGKDNAARNIQNLCDVGFFKAKPMLTKALSMAAEKGNTTAIDNLIKAGADPNTTNSEGKTALELYEAHCKGTNVTQDTKTIELLQPPASDATEEQQPRGPGM